MKKVTVEALVLSALAFASTGVWAQEKHKYLFKTPAGASQYVQQHAIDVGDVPGHQVRVYEIHSTYPNEAPIYDGIKVKEAWTRSVSDYTDGSGRSFGYGVAALENGDQIFTRTELTTQTSVTADESKTTRSYSVTTITGGTGKFKGIHGTLRGVTDTDFKNLASTVTEGEYWIER
jgi:hypothetical protein